MTKAFLAVALIAVSATAQAGGFRQHPRPPLTPSPTPIDVPEPGTMIFLAGGALTMIARRARAGRAAHA